MSAANLEATTTYIYELVKSYFWLKFFVVMAIGAISGIYGGWMLRRRRRINPYDMVAQLFGFDKQGDRPCLTIGTMLTVNLRGLLGGNRSAFRRVSKRCGGSRAPFMLLEEPYQTPIMNVLLQQVALLFKDGALYGAFSLGKTKRIQVLFALTYIQGQGRQEQYRLLMLNADDLPLFAQLGDPMAATVPEHLAFLGPHLKTMAEAALKGGEGFVFRLETLARCS